MRLQVYLLVLMVVRHNVWGLAQVGDRAWVWNMLGAVAMIGLLLVVWARCMNVEPWSITAICCWWAYEEMLVAGASAWYLVSPWPIGPGEEILSARLGFRLGMFSLVAIAFIAAHILDELERQRAPSKSITGK